MSNNMIHINDLSVGDWVLGEKWGDCPLKVTLILDNDIVEAVTSDGRDGVCYRVEDYMPISIMPEILEQNGCTLAWHYRGALKYECEAFSATQERDRWTIACNDIVATIQYVHQLQHLLRIAGATKEINL